jgi:magnesium chelatase family protein
MAAMNPCPCGYLGHHERVCVDNPAAVEQHQARVFGPLLDHFDLIVPLTPSTADEPETAEPEDSSAIVRERILVARA